MTQQGDQQAPKKGNGILYGLIGALIGGVVVAVLAIGGIAGLGGRDESAPAASEQTSAETSGGESESADATGAAGAGEAGESGSSSGTDAATSPAEPTRSGAPTSSPAPTSSTPPTSPPTSSPEPRPWSVSEAAPDGGTYTGVVAQRGPQQANAEYPVSLTFSNGGSFVTYPTLRCSGRLVPAGDVDGTRVYRQTITSGGCDQGGSWHVTREGADAVSAAYRSVRGSFTIEGQLAR